MTRMIAIMIGVKEDLMTMTPRQSRILFVHIRLLLTHAIKSTQRDAAEASGALCS